MNQREQAIDAERIYARIEAALIAEGELASLGHRVVYDRVTGQSLNVAGCHCDPALLDDSGYQARYE